MSMGNQNANLSNYVFDNAWPIDDKVLWTFHPGITYDKTHMGVFVYKEANDTEHKKLIRNAAKYMKILRHPNIVRLIQEEESGNEAYIAVEKVVPLQHVLENLSATEICSGLFDILKCVLFFHEKANLCHNNLSLSSIFVGSDGWKLGGLEFIHPCNEEQPTFLKKYLKYKSGSAITPEEKSVQLESSAQVSFARDAYAFGQLAESLLPHLAEFGEVTVAFEKDLQEHYMCYDPMERLQLTNLSENKIFRNDFLEIRFFLKTITVKTASEKKIFFRTVVPKLLKLDPRLIAEGLTSLLLSRFVLLEPTAADHMLPHLLAPRMDNDDIIQFSDEGLNPILPISFFRKYIIPQLYRIFHVRDLVIRQVLLKNISSFVACFDKEVLQKTILPQILLGLRDQDNSMVALSLHALADLVPVLGSETVIGVHGQHIFKHSTPKFENVGKTELNDQVLPKAVNTDASIKKPSLFKKKPTLLEQSRNIDREKRKQESQKRSEERRKRREQRKKNPLPARVVDDEHDDQEQQKEGNSEEHSILTRDTSLSSTSEAEGMRGIASDEEDDKSATESDIDREIEEQLKKMDSGRLKEVEPPPKVDWSDTSAGLSESHNPNEQSPGKKGALKLKVSKKSSASSSHECKPSEGSGHDTWDKDWGINSGPVESPKKQDTWQSWDKGWEEGNNTEIRANLEDGWGSTSSPDNKHARKQLGFEYDIKSVDVKIKKTPTLVDDIFADMTPQIKMGSLMSVLGDDRKSDVSHELNTNSTFSAQESQDDAGWGDDFELDLPQDE